MEDNDAKLVQRCLRGDGHAWETLVRAFTGRIYNMAYRYTHRFDVAQELTQEIFLRVFQNLSNYKSEYGSFRNWILRVGRNLIIDHYRATWRDRNVAGSDELEALDFAEYDRNPSPFESVYQKEKAETLMRALKELTPELREAVILRDLEELSYQEIAEMLGIPVGTAKSRINRGRIELARVATQGQAVRERGEVH